MREISTEVDSTFERIGNESDDGGLKELVSKLSKPNHEFNTCDPFYDEVRDVVEEFTVRRWLNIEDVEGIWEVPVQDAARAMQPFEPGKELMELDQHDDNVKRDCEVMTFIRIF